MTDDLSITEELTAYLDGELAPEEVLRVEHRLGSDPEYLSEMQALQKTWDLLYQLPAGNSDEAFVRTTMELVVQDATKQVAKKKHRPWVWSLRAILFMALPLLLFAIGFATTRVLKTLPHRELVNNLLLIENLDRYQKLGMDFTFLTKLDEWGLFAEDRTYSTDLAEELPADLFVYNKPGVFPSRETVEQRQQRLDEMSGQQKNELRQSYERFLKLTESQKNDLSDFHNSLSSHPDREQLVRVMKAYCDWLKTLPMSQVARLLDLDRDERLLDISNVKSNQARKAFGRVGATRLPTKQDAEHLFDWYELSINSKETQIRLKFPSVVSDYQIQNPSSRNIPIELLNRFARRQPLNQLVAILMRIDRTMIQDLLLDDVPDIYLLRNGLSSEALAIIDEQPLAGQKELVLNWIDAANQAQATISPERLQEFYEQLPLEERDELDMMAPENWINTLTTKYWQHHNSQRRYQGNRTPFDPVEDWEDFLNGSGF